MSDSYAPPPGLDPAPVQPSSPTLVPSAQLCNRLARTIHDQVLQSLALCLLQTDLCRRLWDSGQAPDALAELTGIAREVESAAEVLRQVVSDLRTAGAAKDG